MPVLSDLEPREVFAWFERLCAIPHGSHHAKAISDYLVAFARERGLACRQDAANNVVIRKAASAGYENAPVVMLQGHIDMVCEKDADCGKDMETEGLDLFVDGDVIGARGTTLGGDDGIAVAMALAVLDADDIPHGPLECVFTADEEVGMIGARALDALHAGLECGILSGKLPELDCISLGPDLTDIHTPRERLHIASTERTWRLLLGTLKRLDA